jgi:hypothetical protein
MIVGGTEMSKRRRSLAVGAVCAVCAALVCVPASSGQGARYVLVEDDWGFECYGSYDHGASMVVPLTGARRPVLRGLNGSLSSFVSFANGGKNVAWADASGLRLADLRTGRSQVLGKLAPVSQQTFLVGPGARTALLANEAGDGPHLILITRHGDRVGRHTVRSANGVVGALSSDGRYAWYSVDDGIGVRAVAGGPETTLGTTEAWWSTVGDRLAYLAEGGVRVFDASTGSQTVDLPVPPDPDHSSITSITKAPWSPDGRYFVATPDLAIDVAAGRMVQLPPFPATEVAWRPRRGHLLLRSQEFERADLVNVATRAELWSRPSGYSPDWSPDGRWILNGDDAPVLDGAGHAAHLPAALNEWWSGAYSVSWVGADVLAREGARVLRVARPPTWRPRVLVRGRRGHHLFAGPTFTATPAGLRFVARTFRARAHARDCG